MQVGTAETDYPQPSQTVSIPSPVDLTGVVSSVPFLRLSHSLFRILNTHTHRENLINHKYFEQHKQVPDLKFTTVYVFVLSRAKRSQDNILYGFAKWSLNSFNNVLVREYDLTSTSYESFHCKLTNPFSWRIILTLHPR